MKMFLGGEHSDRRVQQPLSRFSRLPGLSYWLRTRGDDDDDQGGDDDNDSDDDDSDQGIWILDSDDGHDFH